jgi:endonuclease/exonuclease/phosphatase family metal-dependent hydrolase
MGEISASGPTAGLDITVMSYNVRYANPNDGAHVWENRRDGVASVIRFHRPDVIGVQEAAPTQVDDLRERLPSFAWLSAGRGAAGEAGEYASLGYDADRFEPVSDGTFWLSETPSEPGRSGWDAALPRLVRHARFGVDGTDAEFVHFNTHFDHDGERARRESAALLRDRIDEIAPASPILVTGDFNARPSSAAYEQLTADREDGGRAIVDARTASSTASHGPETTMTDFRALVPDKKIDYVMVSAGADVHLHGVVSAMVDNGRFPSDHLPVLARVSFSASA